MGEDNIEGGAIMVKLDDLLHERHRFFGDMCGANDDDLLGASRLKHCDVWAAERSL